MLVAPFKVLDAAVSGRPYLLGDDFTVADLNVAAVISRAIEMDLTATPNLEAWLTRCLERPAARARAGAEECRRRRDPVDVTRRIARINGCEHAAWPVQLGAVDPASAGVASARPPGRGEKLYARVLKAQRDNFDALHLLGMLNHQRGKAGEAYRLITAALKVQPRSRTRCRTWDSCCTR